MDKKIMVGIGVVILVVVILIIAFNNGSSIGNAVAGGSETVDDLDAVKIPVSEISDKAQFYEYEGIEYFAVKTDDGTIKTAFNACDVCYKSGKGYRQEGKDMICNNCGNHYTISGLGTKNLAGGGCWPGYLPNKVEGNYLVIAKSDLDVGKYRFS